MARITVEDCLEKIENQYDLVLLAKERTSQLNSGAPMLVEEENDKRTVISLREIGDGKVEIVDLKKSAITRLRKEPDESVQLEETDEEENDDFEKLYKGQISKSGIAILPSKRARKIPEKIQVAPEDLEELTAKAEPEVEVNPELEVASEETEVASEETAVSLDQIAEAETTKEDTEETEPNS